jgi:hypothetical protein
MILRGITKANLRAIIIGAAVIYIVIVAASHFSACSRESYSKELLYSFTIIVLGAVIGWFLATICSPVVAEEQKTFSGIRVGIGGVITGYLFGKIDILITKVLNIDFLSNHIFNDRLSSFRVMFFFTSLILTFLLAYILRVYYKQEIPEKAFKIGG